MRWYRWRLLPAQTLFLIVAMLESNLVWSQAPDARGSIIKERPHTNERLSDWLLRRPPGEEELLLGLRWNVPEERDAQGKLKAQLLSELRGRAGFSDNGLIGLLESLPLTGRVLLPATDPRWLQANSAFDPVIAPEQTVDRVGRTAHVALVLADGRVCTMPQRYGAVVQDYITACGDPSLSSVDEAWVIQADGKTQLQKIATWNAAPLVQLSPGAIIWAPPRDGGFSRVFSARLAQFLATQTVNSLVSASKKNIPPQGVIRPSFTVQRDLPLTANDWGIIGVLQTPSARMAPAGEFSFNYSSVGPYRRYNVFVQPFDRLSVGFRYTDITNRLYGVDPTSDRTMTDKSIDFKLRLMDENHLLPQLALGVTDVGGTGIFSSEYLVASKRAGNFDWSLGLGWGYLGASNNLGNPLAKLDAGFNTRQGGSAYGGKLNLGSFFRGSTAIFGGVQYHLPADNWIIKAEYDGNNYQNEGGPSLAQSSPINFGVVYRQSPSVDWGLGLERGSALMLSMTLHAPISRISTPKLSDPDRPAVVYQRPTAEPVWLATVADISEVSGWRVKRISTQDKSLLVELDGLSGAHWNDRIDRIIAVLHQYAPISINNFDLVLISQGIPLSRRLVDREKWALANTQLLPPTKQSVTVAALPPQSGSQHLDTVWERTPGNFGYAITPSWQQTIGGPDAFVLFRAGLALPVLWRLAENWNVSGSINLNLLDNFDKFTYTAPSNLPRVRTYAREYTTESRINVPNLQITHVGQTGRNNYYSLYAGYLESAFAGVGAEWLFRPWHSAVAFGVDLNHVKQRSFNQFFGFSNAGNQTGYEVTTGHATAYWETGWRNVHAKLSAGQYLAGDRGVTLEFERTFDNGVSVGAWATKTNLSAAQFGEGSFDKGMYLKIPFDVLMTRRTGDWANLVYQPLTRDGGAKLRRSVQLYDTTNARSKRATSYEPDNR